MSRQDRDALLDDWSRVTAQKVGMEAEMWAADLLLKQLATLLPRLIAATPADSAARDSYVEQINEFIATPRYGAIDFTLLAGAAGRTGPNEGTGEKGEPT